MRGTIDWQVHEIFYKSGLNKIGESKHTAKIKAWQNLKIAGQKTDSHAIAKSMGIHSYGTAYRYMDIWELAGKYAKENFKVRDMEKLTGEHIRAFLESKIAGGMALATIKQYAAALEKLELGLNGYAQFKGNGREYSFEKEIALIRSEAGKTLNRFEGSRAYADPRSLNVAVRGGVHHLVATIQRESGCRVKEANHIRSSQLRGLREDAKTGQMKGWIEVKGKGGKIRQVGVSPTTYARLRMKVAKGKRLIFKPSNYRYDLKKAAEKTGQTYQGSHGLRWSWAQERFQELQRHGMTYEQAMFQVSNEMGHERGDITEHYLR